MNVNRAKEIYDSSSNFVVQLDGEHSVWIESVDVANGMATVQVGTNPADTQTVSVERLKEESHQ
ncbi:H-type small acid-soluble spore protein [Paenibacillus arenosi]|uniref:H-type small acid-soluble spore protein n=1 Tax=Paenibacillus arenosi TaxID=2774142 RepID=A0ABR9AW08_9BACL|nr:H-type small acid-soluble spore protein [Paenibacillus arenosi]MBD8498310.1 H-type small acid-soluble spore protein [Paenibacillus arenosi]